MINIVFYTANYLSIGNMLTLSEYLEAYKIKKETWDFDKEVTYLQYVIDGKNVLPELNFGHLDVLLKQLDYCIERLENKKLGAFRNATFDGSGFYFIFNPEQAENISVYVIELPEFDHPYYNYKPLKEPAGGRSETILKYFETELKVIAEQYPVEQPIPIMKYPESDVLAVLKREANVMRDLLELLQE